MECGVEHGHLRQLRPFCAEPPQRVDRRLVVQRGEVRQRRQLTLDAIVDDGRLQEARAAVHEAMADGVGREPRVEPVDLLGLVVRTDGRELEAGGAGVDDENPHERVGAGFYPARREGPASTRPAGQTQSRTSGWSSPCSRV